MLKRLGGLMALGLFLIILGGVIGAIGFAYSGAYLLAVVCAGAALVGCLSINQLSRTYGE